MPAWVGGSGVVERRTQHQDHHQGNAGLALPPADLLGAYVLRPAGGRLHKGPRDAASSLIWSTQGALRPGMIAACAVRAPQGPKKPSSAVREPRPPRETPRSLLVTGDTRVRPPLRSLRAEVDDLEVTSLMASLRPTRRWRSAPPAAHLLVSALYWPLPTWFTAHTRNW